jgi:uncharacterized protein
MPGEKDLTTLLKTMRPTLNDGDYVFCVLPELGAIPLEAALMLFKEAEGYTIILTRESADQYQLAYSFVASWITLSVHSDLEAVGLTAAFANALADGAVSCNVVAAFYHDHIFVDKKDAGKAMEILEHLSLQAG